MFINIKISSAIDPVSLTYNKLAIAIVFAHRSLLYKFSLDALSKGKELSARLAVQNGQTVIFNLTCLDKGSIFFPHSHQLSSPN
jgi:hypothetical protein